MPELHLYENDATDWFAAESVEDAVALAREHYREKLGYSDEEVEGALDFEQTPDEKVLTLRDGAETVGRKTAGEWARENGRGFWATTND